MHRAVRGARRTTAAAGLLGILAFVVPGAAAAQIRQLTPQEVSEADNFALGNVVWVLHHEVGHLLVQEFQLPVLGREEDAADNLATVILLEQHSTQLNDFLVASVDAFFLMAGRRERNGIVAPVYDQHGLDKQRAFQVACLMYGSDPVAFADFIQTVDLPATRRDNCSREYQLARSSWFAVLGPHRKGVFGGAGQVSIDYEPAEGQMAEVRRVLSQSGVLEGVANYLNANFALPRPAVLRTRACGQANAYFDPPEPAVVMCYELYDYFYKLLANHLRGP